MRVLGGVAVGPRERLLLVEIGETWLVVGVAPGRVSAVHAMPRPENAGEVEATTQTSPFAHRLKAMLAGRRD
jgi:Flagellar biogenesis protein